MSRKVNARIIVESPEMLAAMRSFVRGVKAHGTKELLDTLSYHIKRQSDSIRRATGERL